jgi:hypothetical protein
MALTTGSFSSTPDPHIIGSATPADAPQISGQWSDTNVSGEIPDASTSPVYRDAEAVYASGSATRMAREAGEGNVADRHTTGSGANAGIGSAFIDGSTLGEATKAGGPAASINGDSGFPGLYGPYPGDQ